MHQGIFAKGIFTTISFSSNLSKSSTNTIIGLKNTFSISHLIFICLSFNLLIFWNLLLFLKSYSLLSEFFFFLYIIPFQYVYCYSFVVPNDLSLIILKKLVKNVWKKIIMNSKKRSVKNVILKINLSAYKWFIKSPSR